MAKSRISRRSRILLGVLATLFLFIGGVLVNLRLGLGPKLDTPPLLTVKPAPSALVFHDVSVFAGVELTSRLHQDVLVENGRIISVKQTGEVMPEGAEIVEGASRTLLPGYVDAHMHMFGSGAPPWAPRRVSDSHAAEAYVFNGVTTGFVLGGFVPDLEKYAERTGQGELMGPRLWYTHMMITAPGGHPTIVGRELVPWPLSAFLVSMIPQPANAAEAEQAVAYIAGKNVHFIKVIVDQLPPSAPEMKAEILNAIVEASRRRGLKVFAHIGTAEDAMVCVRAGVSVLAHGIYRGDISKEQAEEIARHKVPVIFTLAAFSQTAALGHAALTPSALDEAITPREILDSLRGDAGLQFNKSGPTAEFGHAVVANEGQWAKNVRTLYEAGVKLLIGTDSPLPGIFPGSSYHLELGLLSKAGIPNGELLMGATSRAAEVLDLEIGRVEAGRPADLVLVDGDPIADISAASAIEMVLLRGKIVRRAVPVGKAP